MSELAALIEDCGAIRYGEFELSNGATSSYYIDKYIFETQPVVLEAIADAIAARLDSAEIDVVAGPELGAVPLVTAVSLASGIPAAFIRKSTKDYGTQERIEGALADGDRVAIIEDVTTTGGTILETAAFLEDLGVTVERLIVVVDRNEGAVEAIGEAGYDLEYLVQVGTDLEIKSPSA